MSDTPTDKNACVGCAMRNRCVTQEDCTYTTKQRWKALVLGYVLPFVLLAGIIIAGSHWIDSETAIAGIGLGVVGIYYLALYIKKPKI